MTWFVAVPPSAGDPTRFGKVRKVVDSWSVVEVTRPAQFRAALDAGAAQYDLYLDS